MPDDLPELAFVQVVFILLLTFIIIKRRKYGKSNAFYWIIATVYITVLIYLIKEYLIMPAVGEGGSWFAIEMYALIVPGILLGVILLEMFFTYLIKTFIK